MDSLLKGNSNANSYYFLFLLSKSFPDRHGKIVWKILLWIIFFGILFMFCINLILYKSILTHMLHTSILVILEFLLQTLFNIFLTFKLCNFDFEILYDNLMWNLFGFFFLYFVRFYSNLTRLLILSCQFHLMSQS